jgi:2-polyprenyl-6-hydroxyphenyl methylase/3-demethylubiquinone-9 3-methyltransferase
MNIDRYMVHFDRSTDLVYLKQHYSRFLRTQQLAYESWKWDKADILDIGAHWLHQSVLYALDGHHVTAADIAITLDDPAVRRIASKHGIRLLVLDDLGSESAFAELPEDSMDVVLFCEVLEHLTFNPIGMWKAIHRVLKPNGRIILTTPNAYALVALSRQIPRFISGWGSGLSVADILHVPTRSPHWKEFSRKEVRRYFELLSPDFSVRTLKYCTFRTDTGHLNWKGGLRHAWYEWIPVLRKGIYAEIDVPSKQSGITIQPDWYRGSVHD